MKKIFKRVLILIIAGALIVALPIEIIGLVRNQQTLKTEVEDKVEYAVRSAGVEFNIVFNSMESLVNMMQAMVKVTFSEYDYINDFINKNKPTKNTIITKAINILMPTPTLSSSTKSFSSSKSFFLNKSLV